MFYWLEGLHRTWKCLLSVVNLCFFFSDVFTLSVLVLLPYYPSFKTELWLFPIDGTVPTLLNVNECFENSWLVPAFFQRCSCVYIPCLGNRVDATASRLPILWASMPYRNSGDCIKAVSRPPFYLVTRIVVVLEPLPFLSCLPYNFPFCILKCLTSKSVSQADDLDFTQSTNLLN